MALTPEQQATVDRVNATIAKNKADVNNYGPDACDWENHSINEFKCGCCGADYINKKIVDAVNAFERNNPGYELRISSGVRCPKHNAAEGGELGSFHQTGDAVDILLPNGMSMDDFVKQLKAVKIFTCVSPYQTFVHADLGTRDGVNATPDNPFNFNDTATKLASANNKSNVSENETTQDKKGMESERAKILNFLKLVTSMHFGTSIYQLFSNPGFESLYSKIAGFIQQYFYNFYTIPNLPQNRCVVVKPETLFSKIPNCNVILPCMKTDISFTREYKQEPTREFLVTPMVFTLTGADSPMKMSYIAAMEDSKNPIIVKFTGSPSDKSPALADIPSFKVTSLEDNITDLSDKSQMERVGMVRVSHNTGGSEILAYLHAYQNNGTGKRTDTNLAAEVMGDLARYMLLHDRYNCRGGTINMYFNPYIVPGFPMVSLEASSEANDNTSHQFTIYGYVTNVAHNVTDRSWNTMVTFSFAYFDTDSMPTFYPVLEDQFSDDNGAVDATYKEIFGDACECSKNSEVATKFKELTSDDTSIIDAYSKIKRDATTLDDFTTFIMGSKAELKYSPNYAYIENSSYFNPNIQSIIKKYSDQVFTDKLAFSLEDIR